MVSFAVQQLISLIISHLFMYFLFLLPSETDLRKHWYNLCERMFCDMVSWLFFFFLVSCLTFKSLSHFGFIFVRGVRVCSSFIDLHAAVQFSQHHLLKRLSSYHFMFLPPLLKIN